MNFCQYMQFFFASDAVGDAQVGTPFTRKAAPTGDKGNAFNHAIEDYGTISDDSGSITCRARLEYFYTKGGKCSAVGSLSSSYHVQQLKPCMLRSPGCQSDSRPGQGCKERR
eukprot:Opistho-2@55684